MSLDDVLEVLLVVELFFVTKLVEYHRKIHLKIRVIA